MPLGCLRTVRNAGTRSSPAMSIDPQLISESLPELSGEKNFPVEGFKNDLS